jgi:TrmH family RNA methyltransferase
LRGYLAADFQRGSKILKPLSWYKDLADARKRRECGCFLIEGCRAVDQIALRSPHSIREFLITGGVETPSLPVPVPERRLSGSQFGSIVTSNTPQGIAAVVAIPERVWEPILPERPGSRLLLLEHLQDPGNVGTLIRTAAAFGYHGMVLSDRCADPFSPKVAQASAGSVLSLWIRRTEHYPDLVKELKAVGCSVIAADLGGTPLPACRMKTPHLLMLGNEGAGLSETLLTLADMTVCIPIDAQSVESLNVAISGAILMYCGLGNAECGI